MRLLAFLAVATVCCLVTLPGAKAEPRGKVVDEIRKLEEERNVAIVRGDAAVLERLTSDDYTFVTLRGEMRTKAEIVRDFRFGAAKYQSRTISDLRIRVYGDAAVVTGRAVQKGAKTERTTAGTTGSLAST